MPREGARDESGAVAVKATDKIEALFGDGGRPTAWFDHSRAGGTPVVTA